MKIERFDYDTPEQVTIHFDDGTTRVVRRGDDLSEFDEQVQSVLLMVIPPVDLESYRAAQLPPINPPLMGIGIDSPPAPPDPFSPMSGLTV